MQRAAASSSPGLAEDPETPSPKRQRLSTTTSEPATTPRSISDLDAVNAALAAEEQKRAEAVARQAAEAGETNWVLDFEGSTAHTATSQPIIVAADSLDAEDQEGRKSYGGFKSKNRRIAVSFHSSGKKILANVDMCAASLRMLRKNFQQIRMSSQHTKQKREGKLKRMKEEGIGRCRRRLVSPAEGGLG